MVLQTRRPWRIKFSMFWTVPNDLILIDWKTITGKFILWMFLKPSEMEGTVTWAPRNLFEILI